MATTNPLSSFGGTTLDARFRWHCEPPQWELMADGALRVTPSAATDFWRKTHYGFEADNGHFLFAELAGDFVMTVRVALQPVNLYDQAGLMVRLSPTCWLKTSLEFELEKPSRLGAVVTSDGYSDWSTQSVSPPPREVWLRVRREGDDYIVESSWEGTQWEQLRMAHLREGPGGGAVAAGVYACCPKESGFVAEFREFVVSKGRLP